MPSPCPSDNFTPFLYRHNTNNSANKHPLRSFEAFPKPEPQLHLDSSHSTKSKMAAPVGFVGRRFTCKSSPILLLSRSFAAKRFRRKRKLAPYENLKLQDNNVYLLSERDPPKHSFTEAMSALRAYNISLSGIVDQIVELHIRVDMGEKGVSY